jgi:hypothetical protein
MIALNAVRTAICRYLLDHLKLNALRLEFLNHSRRYLSFIWVCFYFPCVTLKAIPCEPTHPTGMRICDLSLGTMEVNATAVSCSEALTNEGAGLPWWVSVTGTAGITLANTNLALVSSGLTSNSTLALSSMAGMRSSTE